MEVAPGILTPNWKDLQTKSVVTHPYTPEHGYTTYEGDTRNVKQPQRYEPSERHAVVTGAAGEESALHALALVQSLRDVGTRVPHIVVMLFKGGVGSPECKRMQAKPKSGVDCKTTTEPKYIVPQDVLDAFDRLSVETVVMEPIPESQYTREIAGGPQIFWGMAFNKLGVFRLYDRFDKLVWLDSDTMVLQNIDHLLHEEVLTAAFTNDCCNNNAPPKMSGGMWVVEPSKRMYDLVIERTNQPMPDGLEWRLGDMELMGWIFGEVTRERKNGWWPNNYDTRQGRPPGMELIDEGYLPPVPALENYHHLQLNPLAAQVGLSEEQKAGFRAAGQPFWNVLDPRYDFLVGDCRCMHGTRDLGLPRHVAAEIGIYADPSQPWWGVDNEPMLSGVEGVVLDRQGGEEGRHWAPHKAPTGYDRGLISLHYSCLPPDIFKPGKYDDHNDANVPALLDGVKNQHECLRTFHVLWYSKFKRAMGRSFPHKYVGDLVPLLDEQEPDKGPHGNRRLGALSGWGPFARWDSWWGAQSK